MPRKSVALAVIAAVMLAGCGSSAVSPPVPSAASAGPSGPAPVATTWSWERVSVSDALADETAVDVRDLVRTDDGLVAVGTDDADAGLSFKTTALLDATLAGAVAKVDSDDLAAAVWTSGDGHNWRRVPHNPAIFGGPGRQIMYAATDGPAGIVAVGWEVGHETTDVSAVAWSSTDGRKWRRAASAPALEGGQMLDVTVFAGEYLAVGAKGSQGAVWTSSDGLIWSEVAGADAIAHEGGESAYIERVASGPHGLVAIGRVRNEGGFEHYQVWTSPDGTGWSGAEFGSQSSGTFDLGDGGVAEIVADDDGIVAAGSIGTWGPSRPDVGSPYASFDAAVWRSTRGVTWQLIGHREEWFGGAPLTQMTDLVVLPEGGYVAVGWASDVSASSEHAVAWYSPEGTTWALLTDPSFGPSADGPTNGSGYKAAAVAATDMGVVLVGNESRGGDLNREWRLAVWIGTRNLSPP